jgi:poly(3-hydroxybutyrate) depolymerase
VLLVAPMSGHYATLLRGAVEAFLPEHEVYVADWSDARMVPVISGRFDLNDYIDHVLAMLRALGPQTHVVAVCQPGPAVLAAVSLMAQEDDPCTPATMTIMGSPIDARRSPTAPNKLAKERDVEWFTKNMIHGVPPLYPGAFRRVYPGFLQLASFMGMNLSRHVDAHYAYFQNLVKGDGDSAEKHREFYDEYLSVMDLTEEFYLQTLIEVFQEYALARGAMTHRGVRVDPSAITKTALLTIEGENDDISGIGQTQAAHDLCTNVPGRMRSDYIQPGVGHYGVFSGRRFRTEIYPRMHEFMRAFQSEAARAPRRAKLKIVND